MHTLLILFQAEEAPESRLSELFDQVLTFLYTLAHWAGQLIAKLIEYIIGSQMPVDLIDPLGFLVLLTLFLIVVEVAKKIAWLVVIVGWVLILVRIVMKVLGK